MHKKAYVEYRPLGVLGIIAPWNYPFHNLYNHVISGLFAGNAVVSKVRTLVSKTPRGEGGRRVKGRVGVQGLPSRHVDNGQRLALGTPRLTCVSLRGLQVSEYTSWSSYTYFSDIIRASLVACGHSPDLVQVIIHTRTEREKHTKRTRTTHRHTQ